MLNSLAVVERENTSAPENFVCACFLSPLPPALYTEAAFLLSGKRPYVIGDRSKSMIYMQVSPYVSPLSLTFTARFWYGHHTVPKSVPNHTSFISKSAPIICIVTGF